MYMLTKKTSVLEINASDSLMTYTALDYSSICAPNCLNQEYVCYVQNHFTTKTLEY